MTRIPLPLGSALLAASVGCAFGCALHEDDGTSFRSLEGEHLLRGYVDGEPAVLVVDHTVHKLSAVADLQTTGARWEDADGGFVGGVTVSAQGLAAVSFTHDDDGPAAAVLSDNGWHPLQPQGEIETVLPFGPWVAASRRDGSVAIHAADAQIVAEYGFDQLRVAGAEPDGGYLVLAVDGAAGETGTLTDFYLVDAQGSEPVLLREDELGVVLACLPDAVLFTPDLSLEETIAVNLAGDPIPWTSHPGAYQGRLDDGSLLVETEDGWVAVDPGGGLRMVATRPEGFESDACLMSPTAAAGRPLVVCADGDGLVVQRAGDETRVDYPDGQTLSTLIPETRGQESASFLGQWADDDQAAAGWWAWSADPIGPMVEVPAAAYLWQGDAVWIEDDDLFVAHPPDFEPVRVARPAGITLEP